MKNGNVLGFVVVLSISMLTLWGCPKKADMSAVPEAQTAVETRKETAAEPAKPEPPPEAKPETKKEPKERTAKAGEGLQAVYFDFDKSIIRDDARSILKANAEWLKAHPSAKIRIEGNCDERGTVEYNQALGQRRAQSAKKHLMDLGVAANRISLISYGKEKPACSESSEECWQKNRRDDFATVNE